MRVGICNTIGNYWVLIFYDGLYLVRYFLVGQLLRHNQIHYRFHTIHSTKISCWCKRVGYGKWGSGDSPKEYKICKQYHFFWYTSHKIWYSGRWIWLVCILLAITYTSSPLFRFLIFRLHKYLIYITSWSLFTNIHFLMVQLLFGKK